MYDPLTQFGDKVFIVDGGFATELERRGHNINDTLWSAKVLLEKPEDITAVHIDYLNAGADLIISSTYQATISGFMSKGFSREQAAEYIVLGTKLAVEARDRWWNENSGKGNRVKPLVGASLGCYGAFLADGSEYDGNYRLTVTEQEFISFHRERINVILEGGVLPDIWIFESVPCLEEGIAISRMLATDFPTLAAVLSFGGASDQKIRCGRTLKEAAETVFSISPKIVALGINCTSPLLIDALLESVSDVCVANHRKLLVYPNSGEEYDKAQRRFYCKDFSAEPEMFALKCVKWVQLGANGVGGCCRTTPNHIRLIRAALIEQENK
eukprot:c7408_g1_i1.p1 GENE.c7408_g1_i1~~c7408_g1_i1.p1  ORF type:complete len:336 (+),score=96.94 c7408_g1_i1:28-1008(+)